MNLYVFQHVPFEGPAHIGVWAAARGHSLSFTRFDRGEGLPDLAGIDGLIVMGGPMGTADVEQYPWLTEELQFLARAAAEDIPILGVCLGAQLLAAALGARVYKNREKEIGWLPVRPASDGGRSPYSELFAQEHTVFQWHGDTFDIPPQAVRLAGSDACTNQGFAAGNKIGLQFHLEATPESVRELVENSGAEIDRGGAYVQTREEILRADAPYGALHQTLENCLELLFAK